MGYGSTINTKAQQTATRRATGRKIARRQCEDVALRRRLEKDCPRWLKTFFPRRFNLPWAPYHLDIIHDSLYAIKHGTNQLIIAPRGGGKSRPVMGVVLYAELTGLSRFPVYAPWKSGAVDAAFRFWVGALANNAELARLYPEFCDPFREAKGAPQRLSAITWDDTENEPTGARMAVSDGLIIMPDSRGIIGSTTINGNPLGMAFDTPDGTTIRPTIIFIDDPEDDKTAHSPVLVHKTVSKIDADFGGMGGPDHKLAMIMCGTVKASKDVISHYRVDPEWNVKKTARIVTWPKDWDKKGGVARGLWEQWRDIRVAGLESKDKGASARSFYKANKAAMTEGMEVSWKERFDKRKGEPDALYSAMWDYYHMGEAAFMAENQGEPLEAVVGTQYNLTEDMILAHANDIPRLHLPPTATVFGGHCDVNHYGLHYCLSAFSQDMTGHCVAWGRYPKLGAVVPDKNTPVQEIQKCVFRALKGLCDQIEATHFVRDGLATRLGLFLIDAGYCADAVQAFCRQARYSFRVLPSIGRDAKQYRVKQDTLVGQAYDNCHVQRAQKIGHGPYLMFHADYWREISQRAFLGVTGEPGGYTLHHVDNKREHQTFAEHVSAEKLSHKGDIGGGLRWEWARRPGSIWDLGDALTGSWVAAAACGLSAGGMNMASVPRVRRRAGGVSVIAM